MGNMLHLQDLAPWGLIRDSLGVKRLAAHGRFPPHGVQRILPAQGLFALSAMARTADSRAQAISGLAG